MADEPETDAPEEGEPAQRSRARGEGAAAAAATPHGRTGAIQFVRECWAELGRVQWPDRGQLWQATAVVILACLVVGVYLYALDSMFTRVAEWLVDQQAS